MGEDEAGTAKAVSERRQEARPTSSTRMTGCPNREVRVAIHNDRSTSIRAIRSLATNVRSGQPKRAGNYFQSAAIAHSGVSFLPHVWAGLDSHQQLMRLRDLRHFQRR